MYQGTNPISVQHYKDSLTSLFHFQSSRAVGSIGTNWGSSVGQDDNGLERVRGKRLGQSSWRRFLSKRWFLHIFVMSILSFVIFLIVGKWYLGQYPEFGNEHSCQMLNTGMTPWYIHLMPDVNPGVDSIAVPYSRIVHQKLRRDGALSIRGPPSSRNLKWPWTPCQFNSV